ncbi:GTPase family protein [Kamptonema formosum]|uniref:GTPase family protein n=1 Tax=Kamptonema formosum TaxID=331992 RepID=UPI000361020A|nr:GTPase family protein [Oscillatoria sp. PCC 10802]
MVRLKLWQWLVLALPVASIIIFLMVAAGQQINQWGINWIWGVFTLALVGWRWLLVRWTRPAFEPVEALVAEVSKEIEPPAGSTAPLPAPDEAAIKAQTALQDILKASQNDPPAWDDWQTFWQRCQELVTAIAGIYYPEDNYPLLNIYVPQAYALIRGTLDDLDRWMQQLSPALNQVTVGQAYQAYEIYQKLEPSARKLSKAWNWAQWLLNPAAAVAAQVSRRSSNRATQELVVNLSQLLREAALRNLCRQAIALYGSRTLPAAAFPTPAPALAKVKTQTLRDILEQAEPVETVEQKPVTILLAGRTGAGKSSLINTLFQADRATVDILPSTERIENYRWQTETGESLTLLDTPGYEQVNREDFRELVLESAKKADLLLLVNPAGDPALQMDVDFLKDIKTQVADLPALAIITQVDRLRPVREWQPPYDWVWGERPKEKAIREATQYRAELLGEFCQRVLPVVTADSKAGRVPWNANVLSLALLEEISPAKQLRLARFLRNLDARTAAAAKIIDRYTFQMATAQGVTALLKSPVLQFLSTLSTGSPTLAYLLAEKIPAEKLPVVIGKLQMAYELFELFNTDDSNPLNFDLRSLWPLLQENSAPPDRNACAFGHALVEFWTQTLTVEQLRERFEYYLKQV